MDLKLPIENDRELLASYGLAFAWINLVELYLEQLIIFKGKLNLVDSKIREKVIAKKTLGYKIDLASSLLNPTLKKKLVLLNERRTLLAHNAIESEVHFDNGKPKVMGYWIGYGSKHQPLTLYTTGNIIELAQSISLELHSELIAPGLKANT